jgi:hypothetical protein
LWTRHGFHMNFVRIHFRRVKSKNVLPTRSGLAKIKKARERRLF